MELDIERLKNLLECSICLQKFENPKMLTCSHQFCKECLEDILVFREDGSATISCPLRCAGQTIINANQTVNDLRTSYEFKGILEVVKTGNEDEFIAQAPKCYSENCTNKISVCCCGKFMCDYCSPEHEKTEAQHQKKKNIFFSKKENKLKILCKEHSCQCTHMCIDNKFMCVYCLHRDMLHIGHPKNTIETEVRLLKDILAKENENMVKVNELKKATEEHVPIMKERLDTLLKARKKEYIDFLNIEEEKIKSEFEEICCDHLMQYPNSKDYQRILQDCDLQLAIRKETFLNTIDNHKNNSKLTSFVVGLSDSFQPQRPLGCMLFAGEEVSLSTFPATSLQDTFEKTGINQCGDTRMQPSIGQGSTDQKDHLKGALCHILDKLTFKRIKPSVDQIIVLLNVDVPCKLEILANLIYDKAVYEPKYSEAYAHICHVLTNKFSKVESSVPNTPELPFRKLLINKVQNEFEKGIDGNNLDEHNKGIFYSDTDKRAWLLAMDYKRKIYLRRRLGNIRLVGELYKEKMISEPVVHDVIYRLVRKPVNQDMMEENLLCACKLLTTVGRKLDYARAKPRMDQYFEHLTEAIEVVGMSYKVKSLLQDVVDLRANSWVPGHDAVPITMDQIYRERDEAWDTER